MAKKKPLIIAISGVAGSGKDSVIEKLWSYPELYDISVSYTDRPIRPGDIPDKTYHFITKEEFDKAIAGNEFIEWEKVRGEYRYGRKKADFEKSLASDKTVILHIDVLGAQKMKKKFGAKTVFIMPPSEEEAIKRLEKRESDSENERKIRTDRYAFEMSFRKKYDYVIINDKLEAAQDELIKIIRKEKEKLEKKSKIPRIIHLSLLSLLVLGLSFGYAYSYFQKKNEITKKSFPPGITGEVKEAENLAAGKADTKKTVATPTKEIKKKIAAVPPKTTVLSGNIAETTKKNTDGSTTTAVSTGGAISDSDLAKAESTVAVDSPADIPYTDETGEYPSLGTTLKSYLDSTLKWKNEVSALKNITVRNAGASGWNGQYLGSYTVSSAGNIVSAQGAIILNTYYIENDYCTPDRDFTNCEQEYAKYIFSHEYGHHYTLYHKWVDWNLKIGFRFPDSYYSIRPLSKATTATDYSLGWSNCEIEIMAEDYSYIYSGYGLHSMKDTYGYPSSATKTWLDNIGSDSLLNTIQNKAPVIQITAPAEDASLSGSIDITASASDDNGISKVSFYIGSKLISEDSASPYSANLNTASYTNGDYVIKAIASDGILTAEDSIGVTFANTVVDTEAPEITITNPSQNPYSLTSDTLLVSVEATDNEKVNKIELYLDDKFQQSWDLDNLSLSISFKNLSSGTYKLKFKAFDSSLNFAETTISIIKP